jgi:hypothetical protein
LASSILSPIASPDDLVALRDWFAGQALTGLLPTARIPGELPRTPDAAAQAAYGYADAMLRARSEPPKTR